MKRPIDIVFTSFLMIMLVCARALAEMPAEPSLYSLCRESKVIVVGEMVSSSTLTIVTGIEYDCALFQIKERLKGDPPSCSASLKSALYSPINNLVHVLSVKFTEFVDPQYDSIDADYTKGKHYLLFLSDSIQDYMYVRTPLDSIWPEHPASSDRIERVREILKEISTKRILSTSDDILRYKISPQCQERKIALTDEDKGYGYARKVEYFVNGEKIGERAWYGNGHIAYEELLKKGCPHGLLQEWYLNGKRARTVYFRDGEMHGPCKTWNPNGREDGVGYWIIGKLVEKKDYEARAKIDPTLPPVSSKE